MKKRIFIIVIFIIISVILVALLYFFKTIPHKQYSNSDFNIETYISSVDKDNDGIDDQTDILNNVRNYISKNPKYKSKYYETGYPNDEYGVCTDVVNLVMNIGAYGVHTNASVLKLVEGFFGERHYPFAPKHKGVFTKRFNRIMIEKIYRNDKRGEVIKRGLKFLLGQNFYSYLKSIVKQ